MTILYDNIIFGPIHSRRLGLSLGVNLLPLDCKLCSFNCIYCECGWTLGGMRPRFHSKGDVLAMLERKLGEMVAYDTPPDVITFAGNGEPTMHPDFEAIVDGVIALRNRLCPEAKVSVLTNATMLGRESVRRALMRVDNPILKLDSAFDKTVQLIDKPLGNYSVAEVVEQMKLFGGNCIVQTMFLRGEFEGQRVDNATAEEIEAWLKLVEQIGPRSVMVYTIDRDTPAPNLEKVSVEELRAIADRVKALGIECSVAG
ncbi:MAG: radical SAM protein [Tidjanibacter sp.]|nr:radical SAM protein [Tidjanibacter sp.]